MGRSKELLLTGQTINANQAVEMGLINKSVPIEELNDYVQNFAQTLCQSTSSQSLSSTKNLLNKIQEISLDDGLTLAVQENAIARESDDCKKGIHAFLNKETLNW